MARVLLCLTVLVVACSSASIEDPIASSSMIVQGDGGLVLTLKDFPTSPGILWTRPVADVSSSGVTVHAIRYGSLCNLAVSGRAAVDARQIAIHISFAERLALCTADFR